MGRIPGGKILTLNITFYYLKHALYQPLVLSTYLKKNDFSTFPPYKSIETQIWPWCKKVKGQPMIIIWIHLVELESSMLHTKIQLQSFFGLEKSFKFLPYMDMAAILFNCPEPFEQTGNTLSTEGPMWNLVKIAQAISEKKAFKKITKFYTCT